ncbi:MAG TPA: serine/threonine-protein kinase, partial [Myxococcaceae bacterium]|nr:serine/threonine-protein kinase [Myxococcaceae bacterium]
VKIVDFGIARRSDDTVGLTRTGFMVGSPGYMAPEQARGDRSPLDHRVDLFALGCVLYECLTGQPPFFGDAVAVRVKVLLSHPQPVRHINHDVSPQLDSLVHQLLSKERDQRPVSAAELAARMGSLPEIAGAQRAPDVAADPSAPTAASLAANRPATVSATFLLFGESSDGGDQSEGQQAERKLEGSAAVTTAIKALDGRLEWIEGRWWMAVLPGRGAPSEVAARAADCALQIRALMPGARMTLVADKSAARLDELIDRAVTTVATDSLASIFADRAAASPAAAGIRLDEATASLLDERYEVTRGSDGLYLQGIAPGPTVSD